MLKDLKKKLGNKWLTFEKFHQTILSINHNIKYRIFPIYVSYYLKDDIVAIVHFTKKFTSDRQLDVGFALKTKPKISGFVDAKYMKYSGINYSIKINGRRDITKKLVKTMKLILK